jgi:hypothetical protein
VVTTIIGSFQERQSEAEEATERLNEALYDQGRLVDDAEKAFKNYLDTTSRFADRNQIDDLDELASKVGLTRERLVALLDMPNMGGLAAFTGFMKALGGENGMVVRVNQSLQHGKTVLMQGSAAWHQAVIDRGLFLDANGDIISGNTDLIVSFEAEAQGRQDAAKANILWMARQGDQQATWIGETLDAMLQGTAAGEKYESQIDQMGGIAALLESDALAIDDWLELERLLEAALDETEKKFLAAAAAAKVEADRIEENGQKAKKLSGIMAVLTAAQKANWVSVVENNEAYKGTIERIDETAARLDIFSGNLYNAIDASSAQNEVLQSLNATFEALEKGEISHEKAVKATAATIRTQGRAAAMKYATTQINIAKASGDAYDADALFREGIEQTSVAMI